MKDRRFIKNLLFVMVLSLGLASCMDSEEWDGTGAEWVGQQIVPVYINPELEVKDCISILELKFIKRKKYCRVSETVEDYIHDVKTYEVKWLEKGTKFILFDRGIMDDSVVWEGEIQGNTLNLKSCGIGIVYLMKRK